MTSHPFDPAVLVHPLPSEHVRVSYSENEDEVDQLDSESEVEAVDPDASSISLQKPEIVEEKRIPGSSLLPSTRIENIIQAECVTGHLSMSKEALFVVSVATEEFVKRLAQAAYRESCNDRRSSVNYHDMASTVIQYQEFMFLEETIPVPLPLHEALSRREAKENEVLEANPTGASKSGHTTLSYPGASKSKGKSRAANGKEKSDGSASGVKKERKSKDVNGRWYYTNGNMTETMGANGVENTWPSCSWPDERVSFRSVPSPASQNGIASYPPEAEYDSTRPPATHPIANNVLPRDEQTEYPPSSLQYQQSTFPQNGNWPGQYTGPASGFLHPHGPFSRSPANSGRTIYSQQHPTESNSIQ